MRRTTRIPIEMECHPCRPGWVERLALWLLIAACICGAGAAAALVLGYIEYHLGSWPL